MLPKKKRLKDKQAIHDVKKIGYCEKCGSRFNLQAHHIVSKGAGGPDHKLNLICLCVECHTKAHAANIPKVTLLEIVAKREGIEDVEDVVREMMQ